MRETPKKEVTKRDLERFDALLEEHKIEALIARHKTRGLSVGFNVEWLDDNALAASFARTSTAGPHYITLSPLILVYGLTDRIAFSTIILHELAHVIDRTRNWTKYVSINAKDDETLEYAADDFVIECGWKDGLIETLRRTIVLGTEHKVPEVMARKRLSRLSSPASR